MTALWTGAALAGATGGALSGPITATGVSIDSRTLRPGDLFVALRGVNDGHAFVAAAFAAGASGAVVDRLPPEVASGCALLRVGDTTMALRALGAAARARFTGKLVAVTGSVGKTTTKEMLRLCLSQGGMAHAAEASHNNHWGVPLTLARMPMDAPAAVVEIGMNQRGEIAPLSRLAAPHAAIITAIGAAHIGNLGSLAAIAEEKATITQGLAAEGTVVLPEACPEHDRLLRGAAGHRVLLFGESAGADSRLIAFEADADGSTITAAVLGATTRFRLAAPGRHMAHNALAALAAAAACGLDVGHAASLLEGFVPGLGRGARRRLRVKGGEVLLLDESYNASPASIRAALEVLHQQPARRRIVVLGDILELGAQSATEHRGLAPSVAGAADLLFTCGPEMRALHDAMPPGLRVAHAPSAAALGPLVAEALRPGDAVLVKGSNGSRMSQVIAALDHAATAEAV